MTDPVPCSLGGTSSDRLAIRSPAESRIGPLEGHEFKAILGPASAPSRRRAPSVRRTTTIDIHHPEGVWGPLELRCRGRDLAIRSARVTETVSEVGVDLVVDYFSGALIGAALGHPAASGLEGCVGLSAVRGFRRWVSENQSEGRLTGLVGALLDDVPGAALISNAAIRRVDPERGAALSGSMVNVCAGWVAGGTLDTQTRNGQPPRGDGPRAEPWDNASDPKAWHRLVPLIPGNMRRQRCSDIFLGDEPGTIEIDAAFRDSYQEAHGAITVIHEYGVRGAVSSDGVLLWLVAVPRVLPAPECPAAAASAARLVGRDLIGVAAEVRGHFSGLSTCTHLNDCFAQLSDLAALIRILKGGLEGARATGDAQEQVRENRQEV